MKNIKKIESDVQNINNQIGENIAKIKTIESLIKTLKNNLKVPNFTFITPYNEYIQDLNLRIKKCKKTVEDLLNYDDFKDSDKLNDIKDKLTQLEEKTKAIKLGKIFLFKKPRINYIVFGILSLIFLLTTFTNLASTFISIPCAIISLIFIVMLIGTIIVYKIESKQVSEYQKIITPSCISDLNKELESRLNSKKNDSNQHNLKEKLDKTKKALFECGHKYQAMLDEKTKEIKEEMSSYNFIDKVIKTILDNYPRDYFHYSKDYMALFENLFIYDFKDEEDFLEASKKIIEIRKEEKREEERLKQEELRRKEEAEREQEMVRREERRRREEVAEQRHREYLAAEDKKREEEKQKAEEMKRRNSAQALCYSCEHNFHCSIRKNLTSPVCSKYSPKK